MSSPASDSGVTQQSCERLVGALVLGGPASPAASSPNRRRTQPRIIGIPDSALRPGVCEAIQIRVGSRSG